MVFQSQQGHSSIPWGKFLPMVATCAPEAESNKNKDKNRRDYFTVTCLVAWPLNESEAGGDLVLMETSLLFSC